MSVWIAMLICALLAVPFGVLFVWLLHLSDRAEARREHHLWMKEHLSRLESLKAEHPDIFGNENEDKNND